MSQEARVLSVYEGFFSGGARILHTEVVEGLQRSGLEQAAFSIHDEIERESTVQKMTEDYCYKSLAAAGIAVASFNRRAQAGKPSPNFTLEEVQTFQQQVDGTDLIMSLKEQPLRLINLADTGEKPVVACLHRSDPENQGRGLESLMASLDLGKLALCICCADSTKEAYQDAGVPESMLKVITNGIDLQRFVPSEEKRVAARRELGIPEDVPTIIFAARYDSMKNVPLFLRAARLYLETEPSAHTVMCGAGMNHENPLLKQDFADIFGRMSAAATDRMHILGIRHDMDALYAASDVVTLTSSFGEAYPLSLVEGIASGTVPVATDVGDCREIVDRHGLIVPQEAEPIAAAWQEAFERRDELMPALYASRTLFDRRAMVEAYKKTITSLIEQPTTPEFARSA